MGAVAKLQAAMFALAFPSVLFAFTYADPALEPLPELPLIIHPIKLL